MDDFEDEESSGEELDLDQIDELTKELSELSLGDDKTEVPAE